MFLLFLAFLLCEKITVLLTPPELLCPSDHICMGLVTVVVPESILFLGSVEHLIIKSNTESVKINSVQQSNQSA